MAMFCKHHGKAETDEDRDRVTVDGVENRLGFVHIEDGIPSHRRGLSP
jgi:hypothetical protein